MKRIAIVGLGYVGLTTSIVFANANLSVICIDKDEEKINLLRAKKMPFYESKCDELLIKNYNKLCFTSNYNEIFDIDTFFICVGTPLSSNNSLNIDSILEVVKNIERNVRNDKIVTICIRSTILPGTCNKIKKQVKKSNICIVHNPEFLSQGSAINDFVNAKRIVIGSDDIIASKKIINLYKIIKKAYKVKTPILMMGTREAEMVKFVANSYLAMRISFINEISNLCKKMDIDITKVVEGVKYDDRIGEKYFKSGIGYGGSCLPKDTNAILKFSQKNGSTLKLVKSTIEINKLQLKKCFNIIKKDFPNLKDKKISLLGVSFKSNTDDIRNSCSLYLTDELLKEKAKINVYDPKGIDSFKKMYGNQINSYYDINKCIAECEIIIIATEWDIIKNYDFNSISKNKKIFIYDFKSCIDMNNKFNSNIKYWSLEGKSNK